MVEIWAAHSFYYWLKVISTRICEFSEEHFPTLTNKEPLCDVMFGVWCAEGAARIIRPILF